MLPDFSKRKCVLSAWTYPDGYVKPICKDPPSPCCHEVLPKPPCACNNEHQYYNNDENEYGHEHDYFSSGHFTGDKDSYLDNIEIAGFSDNKQKKTKRPSCRDHCVSAVPVCVKYEMPPPRKPHKN